jgi:phospholipase/carboxylesterase
MLDGPSWGPASGATPKQLVVICHGYGADGHDLIDLAPSFGPAVPDALFIAVDAPERFPHAPAGRQWWSLDDRSLTSMEDGVRRAQAALDEFLDATLARLKLAPDAYALIGFSQGAMTVLFTGLRRKIAPRAVLAYSGRLIGPELLAAEMTVKPPVLLVHGQRDDVVPVAESHTAEQDLKALGVPVESLYPPTLMHGIDPAGISIGSLALQRAFAADSAS